MRKNILILALSLGVVAMGCQQVDYKTSSSGLQYKILDSHNGPKPKAGDFLKVQMRTVVGDCVLVDTHESGPRPIRWQEPTGRFDLMDGLSLLSAQDSAEFVIPADSVMPAMQRPPFIKAGDKLHVYVKVLAIQTEEQMKADAEKEKAEAAAKDDKVIQDYIAKNSIKATKTKNGVYVVVNQPGSGVQPQAGQTVKVDYTGKSLEGKAFDSSMDTAAQAMRHPLEPLEFTLGAGQMIQGFDDGLLQLKKGAKATLIIPSSLAWGSTGRPPVIKPNEVVVFDVNLLDVTGKPAPKNDTPAAEPSAK